MKEKARKLILSSVLIAGLAIGITSYLLKPTQAAMQVIASSKTSQDAQTPVLNNSGTVAAGSKPDASGSANNAVSTALATASAAQNGSQTTAASAAQKASYGMTDGTYTGPRVYVYYGYVKVQAVVQNGKLQNVQVLEHPNHNGTSQYINSVAMPYLVQEAIQAQSANISLISGATLSSEGFVRSLSTALNQAGA